MSPSVTSAAPTALPLPGRRSGKPTVRRIPSSLEVAYNWRRASPSTQLLAEAKRRTLVSVRVFMLPFVPAGAGLVFLVKWSPRLVSRQRLLLFREALICLSSSAAKFAFRKLVVPAGNAPASSGYQPGALLFSYRTEIGSSGAP